MASPVMPTYKQKRQAYYRFMAGYGFDLLEIDKYWKKDLLIIKGKKMEHIPAYIASQYGKAPPPTPEYQPPSQKRPEEHIILDDLILQNSLSERPDADLAAYNSNVDVTAFSVGATYGVLSTFFDGSSSGLEILLGAAAGFFLLGGTSMVMGQLFSSSEGKNSYAAVLFTIALYAVFDF
jgi:hypothetical protein